MIRCRLTASRMPRLSCSLCQRLCSLALCVMPSSNCHLLPESLSHNAISLTTKHSLPQRCAGAILPTMMAGRPISPGSRPSLVVPPESDHLFLSPFSLFSPLRCWSPLLVIFLRGRFALTYHHVFFLHAYHIAS